MILAIPDVLTPDALAQVVRLIDRADWLDGGVTAGAQSATVKRNTQLGETSDAGRTAGQIVLDALSASPAFLSAALPLRIFPPLFNRYGVGDGFGTHVDNAIRPIAGTAVRVRTDLSATLFLSPPDSYEGGELMIEGASSDQTFKLNAGNMILYPAKSLHRVEPIGRGTRTAAFFWVQSMVRDDGERAILYDLDQTIQAIAAERGIGDAHAVGLSNIYHNLVRRWADS